MFNDSYSIRFQTMQMLDFFFDFDDPLFLILKAKTLNKIVHKFQEIKRSDSKDIEALNQSLHCRGKS